MEYLETQGVFVGTDNIDKREVVEIPGFYCRESGVKSPYSFSSFEEAADIIYQQNSKCRSLPEVLSVFLPPWISFIS